MSGREYRKKALDAHGERCVVCGESEDVIHHKDGDNSNNTVDNLTPLCAACHQKVHAGIADNEESAQLIRELGKHPVFDPDYTTQTVSDELADELYERKRRGESYEDVIWRVLDVDRPEEDDE